MPNHVVRVRRPTCNSSIPYSFLANLPKIDILHTSKLCKNFFVFVLDFAFEAFHIIKQGVKLYFKYKFIFMRFIKFMVQ